MILLFCPVSWRTNPDISWLAEEMAFHSIRPDKELFGFGSQCTGSFLKVVQCHFVSRTYELRKYTNHLVVNFISLKYNFTNEGKFAKYKHFTVPIHVLVARGCERSVQVDLILTTL